MPRSGLFEWKAGAGWLVLIGGTSDRWRTTEAIDRAAIALTRERGPVAFVPAAGCPPDYGETFLETYARLGVSDGYVVPVHDATSARDPRNTRLLAGAGLIYFGGGETTQLLETMTATPALEAVAAAYAAGAVVVGMSAGAIALAAWGVPLNPAVGVLQGWGWLPRTIVSVHHTPDRDEGLRTAIAERPEMLGLGLAEDAAIALGPDGSVEQIGGEPHLVPGPQLAPP
jgi:cyanophycinase